MSQKKLRGLRKPLSGNRYEHVNNVFNPDGKQSDLVPPGSTFYSAKADTPQREQGAFRTATKLEVDGFYAKSESLDIDPDIAMLEGRVQALPMIYHDRPERIEVEPYDPYGHQFEDTDEEYDFDGLDKFEKLNFAT